jgi:hypothetical protein|tara:strand:+ start:400 stop:555 length:156 start_codon:yes stop_codon:yes gene_type:complete
MNDAFEGTETAKSTKGKTAKDKKKKEAPGLEPILEEKNDQALAIYKPDMSL